MRANKKIMITLSVPLEEVAPLLLLRLGLLRAARTALLRRRRHREHIVVVVVLFLLLAQALRRVPPTASPTRATVGVCARALRAALALALRADADLVEVALAREEREERVERERLGRRVAAQWDGRVPV